MGKVKVKQIPEVLSPTGEHIVKIWYDKNTMPPKNYIWCTDEDEYYIWDGKKWIPYEFELIGKKEKNCYQKTCGCITEEELANKFENFKKDLITVVIKLIKNEGDVDVENLVRVVNNIDRRVTTLESSEVDLNGYATEEWVENKHYLTESSLDNYYTKQEVDNKALDRAQLEEAALDLGFVKMIDLTLAQYNALSTKQPNVIYNITDAEAYHYDPSAVEDSIDALRNSISTLRTSVNGVQTNISTMMPIVNRLNDIDHSQFVTADDLADFEPVDPSSIVNPEDLEGYATEEYVDRAISNVINSAPTALDTLNELATALGNDANFATTVTNALANKANISDIPTATSQLTNDSVFITQAYDDTTLRNRVTALENKPFDSYLTTDEEVVISASLNDLNDRVSILEDAVDDIPSDTSDLTNNAGFITQVTADSLYEPKFVDLTNESDPEAEAQTHTSDNKIYITEVIEPEQGGE